MLFIGLTGGFGTGKTTILQLFKKSGACTLSSDTIVNGLLKKPVIIKKIAAVLGEDILLRRPGKISINKTLVARIIFSNPSKRRLIEKIIHPEVLKAAKNFKTAVLREDPDAIIVFEVPLLFEAGMRKVFDKIIVVKCSRAKALRRLARKGVSGRQALARMRAQLPMLVKTACADFLIDNNSGISSLKPRVRAVIKELADYV